MHLQSTTNPLKCQLFLNVFSETLQGSLSLARHALLRHFAFLQSLLLTAPLFFEPHHPVKFAHVGESGREEGLCSCP